MRESLRVVRRMAAKLPCFFWFVLLFGAGGLVLFIHLEDLSEMVQRQEPDPTGVNLRSPPRQSKEETWRRIAVVQEARRRLVKQVCAKFKSSMDRTIMQHHVSRIYVEDNYKILFCEVPKAGCTNWKRILLVLDGLASSTQIHHEKVHNSVLRTLNTFQQKDITKRLQTYTKMLVVREPLQRLVSAYRDKFENPNVYYHPRFGIPIISKYRANASKDALMTGHGVTFQEFIQYLLDVYRPVGMDIHWESVNQLCHPCLLDYDFIGKFENIEEEADFLLRMMGAPGNLTLPTFKDKNPDDERTSMHVTHQYFAQINASDIQRVYDYYYMDYLMFNFSKPYKDLY
ncbi:carbohydrate sulfotransferase 8-like [Osmerus mordax]|uniref:carbohydrate sulfotransferase 8-like n=1 Tax=Osmerus mordax TaxID=8014 RepID=UPI00350F6264